MTMLGTIARGLRSRALLSVGSALLVALAVGAAVLGPMFSVAVTRSYAVTRINEAPAALTGTSWVFAPDSRAIDGRSQAVTLATEAVAAAGGSPHARPVVSLESERFPALTGQVMLLAVEGACEHLQVEGRCPVRQGEALMSEIDLPAVGVEIGDQVDLGGSVGLVTVVGSYRAPTEDDFWFQPLRLGSMPAHGDDRTGVSAAFQPAPLVVVASTFDRLPPGSWTVRVDNRLRVPPDFTPADLTALAHATGDRPAVGAQQRVEGGTLRLDSADDLAAVAREVGSEQRAATDSIAPAVISLVLVALALLTRLLLAASELRVPELALASLRGMAERRLWALGLAEPLALLVVAAPVGAVLGVVMTWGLVRAWLVPGLPLIVPTASLLGAVLVTAAGCGRGRSRGGHGAPDVPVGPARRRASAACRTAYGAGRRAAPGGRRGRGGPRQAGRGCGWTPGPRRPGAAGPGGRGRRARRQPAGRRSSDVADQAAGLPVVVGGLRRRPGAVAPS